MDWEIIIEDYGRAALVWILAAGLAMIPPDADGQILICMLIAMGTAATGFLMRLDRERTERRIQLELQAARDAEEPRPKPKLTLVK